MLVSAWCDVGNGREGEERESHPARDTVTDKHTEQTQAPLRAMCVYGVTSFENHDIMHVVSCVLHARRMTYMPTRRKLDVACTFLFSSLSLSLSFCVCVSCLSLCPPSCHVFFLSPGSARAMAM